MCEKSPNSFRVGPSCVVDEMFIEVPPYWETSPVWKNSWWHPWAAICLSHNNLEPHIHIIKTCHRWLLQSLVMVFKKVYCLLGKHSLSWKYISEYPIKLSFYFILWGWSFWLFMLQLKQLFDTFLEITWQVSRPFFIQIRRNKALSQYINLFLSFKFS